MARRKKLRSRREHQLDPNVNITALLDVMTVLLFFLIKSFTVTSSVLNPPADLKLPTLESETDPLEAVTLSISPNRLLANADVLVNLSNGSFRSDDVGDDGLTIKKLKAFMDQQQKKRMSVYKGAGDLSFIPPGKVLIQADKKLSFNTVKRVLHTAATSGYGDYQLVVALPKK